MEEEKKEAVAYVLTEMPSWGCPEPGLEKSRD